MDLLNGIINADMVFLHDHYDDSVEFGFINRDVNDVSGDIILDDSALVT